MVVPHLLPGTPGERDGDECDSEEDSSDMTHHEFIRDLTDGSVLELDAIYQIGEKSEAEACTEPGYDQGDSPEPPVPEGIQEVEEPWPDCGHEDQNWYEAHGVTPFLVVFSYRRGLFP